MIAVAVTLFGTGAVAQDHLESTVRFTIPEYDLYPESIAYDPVSGDFFLSSMGHPRILRVHADGSYEDFLNTVVPDLASSIGMKVDAERRILWVCTGRFSLFADLEQTPARTGVLQFDLDSGTLLGSWMLDQESVYHIFNDIAVATNGEVYATTTLLGGLYKITPGVADMTLVHQLELGSNNNGITFGPDGRYLFVTVDRRIERLELATGDLVPVTVPNEAEVGTDGLYFHDGTLISVRPRFNNVSRLVLDSALGSVLRVETLVEDHPDLAYPTTGVMVGDTLVFVATSFADTPRQGDSGPQHGKILIHQIVLR